MNWILFHQILKKNCNFYECPSCKKNIRTGHLFNFSVISTPFKNDDFEKYKLDIQRVSSMLKKFAFFSSVEDDLKFVNEKIAEVENSNLSTTDKALQIKILRDTIETLREIQ
ncbi:hypothetical protein [Arcobacter defluvii]|uniref:Uncharacterized protein n=1 Tax=Arcobacter defluvii TaxID=873191 RepID=A0AAE7E7K0_9BACT|nr:hypothetical protein [Arcobacter defluvii]QKF77453.1 hypothetical protein ADFLV_1426 [Arcobacter defluvii]RXI32089.1 hypothetical protein CP964_08915 [Arcobacter defluvii]